MITDFHKRIAGFSVLGGVMAVVLSPDFLAILPAIVAKLLPIFIGGGVASGVAYNITPNKNTETPTAPVKKEPQANGTQTATPGVQAPVPSIASPKPAGGK